MVKTTKGKRTLWLTETTLEEHKRRAAQMAHLGYDVAFIGTIKAALESLNDQRPTCILIDVDRKNQQNIAKSIERLNQHPELSSTKFILSLVSDAPDAEKAAASENFRDLIPFSLSDERWLQRFKHAASAKPVELAKPLCEISMNQLAMAYAPARVVWISETHMRIECRGGQTMGSNLQITGAISADLGVPYISLTVESVHRDELMYRFSQALTCRWRVPESHVESAKIAVKRQISAHPGQATRFRAFVAVSNPEIRRGLATDLNKNQVEVKVALLRSTMAMELSFFTPDVIFLDHKIIASLEPVDLQLFASKLDGQTQVVIFNADESSIDVKKVFSRQKIHFEASYEQKKIADAIKTYNLNPQAAVKADDRRMHILPDQAWSRIELQMPARLTSLNPTVGQISLPFSVSAFAAVRLEAPILRKSLGRAPYVRILGNTVNAAKTSTSQFVHHGSFYLADVTPREEVILSEALLAMVDQYYKKHFLETALSIDLANSAKESLSQAAGFASETVAGEIPDARGANAEATLPRPARPTVKPRRAVPVQKSARYAPAFKLSDYVDTVVLKAILVFAFAMAVVLGLLSLASRIDPSFYKDHGRQYSDFFLRMTDPEFREKNPTPQPPGSFRDQK
jgi:hypothetical protein